MANAGDMPESFVEIENKVDIGETLVNLDCVKKEPKEEVLDFEEDSDVKQYRITLKYENVFGESLCKRKFEEDCDNLVGFLDDDVIMESTMIKLEDVKEEDEYFSNFHCSKCKGDYKGYCLKCSTLLRILNNASFITTESNTIPLDIIEIRETTMGKGAFLLRTLPINVIFGPFEGLSRIESTVGYCWKINDNKKLVNIQSGNWMKNIVCAANASFKNLDIIQVDGDLYLRTNREIIEGEEMLIYYNDEELRQLANSEECLYIPQKQKLPKIFACTLCCLGYVSNKCLMEHKKKCPQMKQSMSMKDFKLIECHYCKIWLERWEHEKYHVAYCLEKHHRVSHIYSEAVDRIELDGEEMKDDCSTKDGKRTCQRDMYSKPYDRRNDVQFGTKDYQCVSEVNLEMHLNKYTFAKRTNNERTQNTIEKKFSKRSDETNAIDQSKNYLNQHRDIVRFQCDICMTKFTLKGNLNAHIKAKHAENGSAILYKCSECSYDTRNKYNFQSHINKHRSIIKQFQCHICMKKFSQKNYLKAHIKNMHTGNKSARNCSECSYQTNRKDQMKSHVNEHRGTKQLQSDICMMKFAVKDSLSTHIKTKLVENGSAKDCRCSECSYKTDNKHSLNIHMNTQTAIKPFECNTCMTKFTKKAHLMVHVKNKHNENDKYYKCSECSFETNYKQDLNRHMNTHRGIKPFQCGICMTKFTEKSKLTKHIKNKHTTNENDKDYKCSECFYQTNYKHDLNNHIKTHTGIKPFECDTCMMKFTTKSSLNKHVKSKHTQN